MAQLDALKFDPDLDCSPSKTTHKLQQDAQARAARVTEGEREMQLAVVQSKAAREAAQAAQTAQLCARGEHDFSGCTKCRLFKNHGHWAQDCPEARKADWNERNGEQERRGRVTGIQPATKKGSKNLLTHTHNTLTYTDLNTALCNEEMLATLYVWLLKFWIMLPAMKNMLATLCVTVEVLNNALCNEEMLATLFVWLLKFWIMLLLMNVWECTKV